VKYLLDTNVVSELRKGSRANARVVSWYDSTERDDKYVSALTAGEIRRGIETIRRRDPAQARALDRWLRRWLAAHRDRVLAVDAAVADRWGRLTAGSSLPVIDGLLAATALVHGLTLATRNVKDIEGTGVPVVNPFETLHPPDGRATG
jgi:predicted nucleic acid-binding protein